MNINIGNICNDLLAIQLDDGIFDLSWALDTDQLKDILEENYIQKILNLQDNIDFIIEVDSVNTFDSINLKTYKFSEQSQCYRGNIVFSTVIDFNKNKFEETEYHFRVKIVNSSIGYNIFVNNEEILEDITLTCEWSNSFKFTVRKNYTKDLVETMYSSVADFNSYNKEAKSANMYYIFQSIASVLNKEFDYIQDEHNRTFIHKSLPDMLLDTFGVLFKFDNTKNLSMEEYRRILIKLIIAYQHGGAWNYIKEVLKYLMGHTPDLITLKSFYPWILRRAEIAGYNTDGTPIYNWNRQDPENFSDRNYYNPDSNYYLYKTNFFEQKNKNETMLLDSNEKLFTFIVKSSNFFNRSIDKEKLKQILNLLKSAYTKYSLNIEEYIEPSANYNYMYVDDENLLLVNNQQYFKYK